MAEEPTTFLARAAVAVRYAVSGITPEAWFGPGRPLAPMAPEVVRGRTYDIPYAANVTIAPRSREPLSFQRLKWLADALPQLRLVIERQKDLVEALEWTIKPRASGDTVADAKGKLDDEGRLIAEFLQFPDGEHDWAQWIRAVLEQLLVIDAVSIYYRPTRAGQLYSLDIIDGATIKPIVDGHGKRPPAPQPAYAQVFKGMPSIQYSSDELLYYPQNFRVDKVYGYSRVEHVVDTIDMAIKRGLSQAGYYDHGNVTDGYFVAPEGWDPNQIKAFEDRWNALMQASIAGRRQVPWVPAGTEFKETKIELFDAEFDEWLMRLVCFGFGVSPTPFLKQVGLGHGSAETDQDAAEAAGIKPLSQYITRLMNRILARVFQRADLEFTFTQDEEYDPKTASEIDDRDIMNGTTNINAVLDRKGMPAIEGGDDHYVFLPSGPIAVKDLAAIAARNAEPPPPPIMVEPGETVPGKPGEKAKSAAPAANDDDKAAQADALEKSAKLAARRRAALEASLQLTIQTYLLNQARILAPLMTEAFGLEKVEMEGNEGRIEEALDSYDWAWADFPAKVQPILVGIAVPVGHDAVSELGLFDADTMAAVTARATEWASKRAADLVGMKWVDGDLVVNPSAKFNIAETTRKLLRGVLTDAMQEGATTADVTKAIMEATAFSKERASTIARTEMAEADVQGHIAGWKESGVVAGKQFSASPDCCDECQSYDGEIVGLDDEFSFGDTLPHPNCLPGDSLVTTRGKISAVSKRWYDGDLLVIRTASGKNLSCTPNHPILTSSGWVAARVLNVGDDVVCGIFGDGVSLGGRDDENVPARIEDIAESFSRSEKVAPRPVPVAAEHFHGDGEGSEVAIIWTDRFLGDGADSATCKHCGKDFLPRRDVETPNHDGARVLDLLLSRFRSSGGRPVSSGDLSSSSVDIHGGPLQSLGLGQAPSFDAIVDQPSLDGSPIDADDFSHRVLGHSARVELDHIVDVSLRNFAGHVFNIQTEYGFYIAQGIISHNCRCDVVAVLPEDLPD